MAEAGHLRDPAPRPRRSVDLGRLAAPLPALLTALAFACAWLDWGSDYATLMARTVQLEFVVIHAGLFFGVFLLMPTEMPVFGKLRWIVVGLLCLLYGYVAYSVLAWYGVLAMAGAMVATYGGLFLSDPGRRRPPRVRAIAEIAVRWVVSFFSYMLAVRAFSLPEEVNDWAVLRESVALGSVYFAALAVIEASGLYRWIRGRHR